MVEPFQSMPPFALHGRIVTMDDQSSVIKRGVIYIHKGSIAGVTEAGAPAPGRFGTACGSICGTIYPGLIELHNHLPYNILPLWNVPETYPNRAKWSNTVEKRKLISGPMQLLNEAGGYLGAIIRFVEAKCLLAGVTTSQGLTLVNASGIEKKYRGIVRNAEEPDDDTLPKAGHRIGDVDPQDAEDFLSALKQQKGCYLLHLSEGVDPIARQHFLALQFKDQSTWAITDALAGIHAAGLEPGDFAILKQFGGSMVWSPMSNLLLYGDTAKVRAAKQSQVPIALGSDWSPSGSKNLLGELKVARLYSRMHGNLFADLELVRMATRNPAKILKWGHKLGAIGKGMIADLLIIDGQQGDPYRKLLTSSETDICLVVIGGNPRYGASELMQRLGQDGEAWRVGTQERIINLVGTPDADVSAFTLKEAQEKLKEGLNSLPNPPALQVAPVPGVKSAALAGSWQLALDNDGDEARAARVLAPLTAAEMMSEALAAAINIHDLVEPVELDELTVAENPAKYFDRLAAQKNLPDPIKDGLPRLYGL